MESSSHKHLGHVYITGDATILFTKTELRKIPCQVHHQSTENLGIIINQASPEK